MHVYAVNRDLLALVRLFGISREHLRREQREHVGHGHLFVFHRHVAEGIAHLFDEVADGLAYLAVEFLRLKRAHARFFQRSRHIGSTRFIEVCIVELGLGEVFVLQPRGNVELDDYAQRVAGNRAYHVTARAERLARRRRKSHGHELPVHRYRFARRLPVVIG